MFGSLFSLRLRLVAPSGLVSNDAEYKAWLPPVRRVSLLIGGKVGIRALTGHLGQGTHSFRFFPLSPGPTSSTRRLVPAP